MLVRPSRINMLVPWLKPPIPTSGQNPLAAALPRVSKSLVGKSDLKYLFAVEPVRRER